MSADGGLREPTKRECIMRMSEYLIKYRCQCCTARLAMSLSFTEILESFFFEEAKYEIYLSFLFISKVFSIYSNKLFLGTVSSGSFFSRFRFFCCRSCLFGCWCLFCWFWLFSRFLFSLSCFWLLVGAM